VVGIAVVLTGILTVYTRNSEKQIVFMKEQSLLVSSLLRAKAFAIETFQTGLNPGLQPSGERICGWGVHFERNRGPNNPDRYIIFKHLAPGANTSCPPISRYTANQGEEFEILELDSRLEISCLAFDNQCTSGNQNSAGVVFIPPDPITKFYNPQGQAANNELFIVLKLKGVPRETVVKVNKFGQITF